MGVHSIRKVAVVVGLLVLLAGCSGMTDRVSDAGSAASPTETGVETQTSGEDLAPPAQKPLEPADAATPADDTTTDRRGGPESPDGGASTATPASGEAATTAVPEEEKEGEGTVRPIRADARHPEDPGESTLTLEPEKTIRASAVASHLARNVNATRRSHGYPALAWHEPVASTGRAHAADMFDREYFAHENPEGERAWDRYAKTGHEECVAYGENNYRMTLGYEHSRYEEMTGPEIERYVAGRINTGFRRSDEGHRELMLGPQYTHVGIGVHLGEDRDDESRIGRPYEIHVVEQFCAPASLRPVVDERLRTYDEPEPDPSSTPTPVPIPGETPTASATSPTTSSTATPATTATETTGRPNSSGSNVSPELRFEVDEAEGTATVTVDWGDAGGLGVVFEDRSRSRVLREADGDRFVLEDVTADGRVHVTVWYPDGSEEVLGWVDLT